MRASRAVMPSMETIATYWEARKLPGFDQIPLMDAGEPECFACGYCPLDHYKKEIKKKISTKNLQRAHVVPWSLGGSNDPQNFAILCKRCHEQSPDTSESDIFWSWVAKHPRSGSLAVLFAISTGKEPELREYTGPGAKYVRALTKLSEEELKGLMAIFESEGMEYLKGLICSVMNDMDISTHFGVGIAEGTWEHITRQAIAAHRQADTN